jgi:5-methyltetrahydropteroyltriglutamate--homocysteine methyltransferase
MAITANLGFPRIGVHRELKRAIEGYWAGRHSAADLEATAADLRRRHWLLQRDHGITQIPSNDFSLYDQVLDTLAMVGAVPVRYGWQGETVALDTYFAMARGTDTAPPLEMTKWFDTNYHYLVPEFTAGQTFRQASHKAVAEFREARELGIPTRPVLLGPLSFLYLGKYDTGVTPYTLLTGLLPVYEAVLAQLAAAGADWVQIDEPILALDLPPEMVAAFPDVYARLHAASSAHLCLATYFGDLGEYLAMACRLPVQALHLDLVRAPQQLEQALAAAPESLALSLGVIDGRNIWRADLCAALALLLRATAVIGTERLQVAPSCSLLHCPVDLAEETTLDDEARGWLAFAVQKLNEVQALTQAITEGPASVQEALRNSRLLQERRRQSPRIHQPAVQARLTAVTPAMIHRTSPYPQRRAAQQALLPLPVLPTTTIGSFPQTYGVRSTRAAFKKGAITQEEYDHFLAGRIEHTVLLQEAIGLDVLVHGEAERNDMVEYFGEQLAGTLITRNGWVQSYGTRCAKPPIICGDISRPAAMTVRWSAYAQSLTTRPVKGMLTGPITILQWSFVRDDQPRRDTAYQLALALRDEVEDLEAAGLRIIQIDEPALREGLPLRRQEWAAYLEWAVHAFKLASSGVRDETSIHTHMCYCEFNDIFSAITALDADVISLEASRSKMELLQACAHFSYPAGIGPGIYDIHSPRVPSVAEMRDLLQRALAVLRPEQLWVNPDCGLKTRNWPETEAALRNMVAAAHALRAALAASDGASSPTPER